MRIVYVSIGMASPLYASFELSRRLRAVGHEVIYSSPADIEAEVRAHGFDFVPLVADREPAREAEALPLRWRDLLLAPPRFVRTLLSRRRLHRRSLELAEIAEVIEDLGPDRLVIDLEMHYAIQATARLGIPTCLAMLFFSVHRRPGAPPLHTALPFAEDAAGRLRVRLAWWRLRLETAHFEWRRRLGKWRRCRFFEPVRYDTFDLDDLRALARRRGFDLRRETSRREWLRPFMYRRRPVMCFNAREMDWPLPARQAPAPNVRYVGAMVQQERAPSSRAAPCLERWRAFDAARRAGGEGRPLVYCSLGSFWSADRDFLSRVLDVFTARPDWDLVLGLGGRLDAGELGPVPDNALVLDWAPQVEILRRADVAITHGGVATLGECVRFGVPMLVYSTGFVDQDGNGARVVFHGLGVSGDKDRDRAEDLEGRISKILSDSTLLRRLGIMRRRFLAYESTDLAVQMVEYSDPSHLLADPYLVDPVLEVT